MIKWKKYYKNIPSSVKIGKHSYTVLFIKEFPKDHTQLGESSFGEEKQIIINLNQSIKEQVLTYIHEVYHICSFEYDIGLTENQVLKLENTFKDFFKVGNLFLEEVRNATKPRKRKNTKRVR